SDLLLLKGDSGPHSLSSHRKPEPKKSNPNKKWIWVAASFIIVLFVGAYFYFNQKNTGQEEAENTRQMIVVLPFENLGSQDENYFADGVTEEITSKLAAIGNIGVISRNTAEKLAKSNKSTTEIGTELGVNYILSGTIRWAKGKEKNNRVRITPQLTRVSDNTITWSDSYDKVLDDIFSVQNDIAQIVVDQLSGSLGSDTFEKIAPPTDNLEAYDFYLKGLAYDNRGGYAKSDFQTCADLYQKAIDLDPNFAQAYANLSRIKSGMYWFFYDRSEKNVEEALDYANKSLQLNPDLAEVHLAFGYYYYWCELNYSEAIKEFTETLKIQPNNSEAYFGLGVVYRRMGNFNLSLKNQIKAYSLDPLSFELGRNIGETYGLIRDYANTDKYYKHVIELNPDRSFPKIELAQNYINWKGDIKSASELVNAIKENDYLDLMPNYSVFVDVLERKYDKAIQKMISINRNYETGQFRFTPKNQELGLIYRYKNERGLSKAYFDSSRVLLEEMIMKNPQDERLHSSLGITYAGLDFKEKAIAEGKKGIELLPLEKEAYRGYYREWDMAIIYTLIGDYDNALKKIDFILSIPGAFSVNQLKLEPLYDPLRNLAGYKSIVEKYSVK
ncbi:MAG: hypothetical protein OQJ78_08520, partial [Ignavibacteriaceae bacterium]|nr:hypothetical protein [Ignavibacteriaceae bacterium]